MKWPVGSTVHHNTCSYGLLLHQGKPSDVPSVPSSSGARYFLLGSIFYARAAVAVLAIPAAHQHGGRRQHSCCMAASGFYSLRWQPAHYLPDLLI